MPKDPPETFNESIPLDERRVSALRRRIQAGEYAVNANSVANTIVRKLKQISQARQHLDDPEGDRSHDPARSSRPDGESAPPPPEQSDR
jgi:hypothetical protein